jgi:16S rRNA (cytidine1402-2'-O)-methyltransferase
MPMDQRASVAHQIALSTGVYFVATPIGNARDITLRALDILASCDVIAAEDTRTARHLMELHGIALRGRQMIAYHDHNGDQNRPKIMRALQKGASVAYVSEAGTPLVADPGYQLCRAVVDAGFAVTTAPGASAVLAAITVSGLPSDRFMFVGFAPQKGGDRARWLADLQHVPATLILYESPKRIQRLVDELCAGWGGDRPVALCREITKRFEETARGNLAELRDLLPDMVLKGEMALVIGQGAGPIASDAEIDAALRNALQTAPVKQAAADIAQAFGRSKRDMYQRALTLK